MKQLYLILLLLTSALMACEDDFDEMADSDLRRITFIFDTSHMLDNVLVQHSGSYSIGAGKSLDSNHLLRLTSYCYDSSDSLLQRHTLLFSNLTSASQTFSHLDKNARYRFLFVADVVLADPDVDYYETWYQMNTHRWKDFYFFSDSRNEQPQHDVMQYATAIASPSNQTEQVVLEPLTYNGYCLLTNVDKVDRITGFAGYVNAFMMSTKIWQRRSSTAYEFSHYRPAVTTITQPLSLCYADSIIYLKVKSTTLNGTDSVMVSVDNANRRPFVLTIDCEASQMTDCRFY